jgi:hypothetical protein
MTSIRDGREPWMTSTRQELSGSGGAPVERKFGILAGLADHSASAQGADQHRSLPAGARAATVLKAVSRVAASADKRQEVLLAALRVAAMTAYGHAVELHGVQAPSKRAARLNTDHCRFQRDGLSMYGLVVEGCFASECSSGGGNTQIVWPQHYEVRVHVSEGSRPKASPAKPHPRSPVHVAETPEQPQQKQQPKCSQSRQLGP